jgi:protein-S-isoprenylcysteine O-methyltransferase Ste14
MKLLPPVLVGIFAVAMIASRVWFPGVVLFGPPWVNIGLLGIVGGLYITVSAASHFRRVHTNIKTFDDPNVLVTDGWFKVSRNPMYLGFALFLASIAIGTGALIPLVLAVLFVVIADRWYIRYEEQAMQRVFGEAYEDYCRTVRRWL